VDGRNEDVAGFVVVELDDEFCQVGFQGGDTAFFQVFVHADFLGGHGLDLDDLLGAFGGDE
jgi:hypothetical protein